MKIRKNRDKEKTRKDLFHSESAAATAIAAVLLLSIIFSIFVVVRVAYVPEWKNDAEQLHMSEVQEDMTELKTMADTITLLQSVYPVSVPISMGGGEIPVLEPSKSSGTLSVNTENFAMIVTPKNHPDIMALGGITYRSNNRQYVDQTLRYENGALILNQDDKSVMKQPPSFNITEEDEYYNVSIRAINVIGDRDSTSSDNDASLTLTLNGSDFTPIDSEEIDSFTCTIYTKYPDAWISFLKSRAENAGLKYTPPIYNTDELTGDSTVIFKFYADPTHHFRFNINEAFIKTEIGSGSRLDYTTHNSHGDSILPDAKFSSNVSQGFVPLTVQFNDSSENATGWIWDFGDGSKNSYDRNPTHTYRKEGNYTVTLLASNLNGTDSKDATINVSKLTPTITWSNPVNITYGTSLSETQLNASASTPGNYTYRPAAGTLLGIGTHTLHVDFTPTDSVNYTNISKDVTISIQRATPLIIWSNPVAVISGTELGDTQLNAVANDSTTGNTVPGDFVYTPVAGTILSAGTHALHADFTPDDTANYTNASKDVTINVLLKSYAYITNYYSNSVSVIDTTTNTVTATVTVGSYPIGVAVSSDGTKAYVANSNDKTISIINTNTNTVTATVDVGKRPIGVAISPDGTKVYVTNNDDKTVSVINTSTNTVTAKVTVGRRPYGVAISPDGTKVYVTNSDDRNVSIIKTSTDNVTATVPVERWPYGVAVSPDGTKVYVVNKWDSTVSVINAATNTITASVTVGYSPDGVAVSPDGTKVYVANSNSDTVSVIDTDTNSVTAIVSVGKWPCGVAVSPDGTKVYVVNSDSNNISVIDTATNTVTTTIPVGNNPVTFGQFIATPQE